MTPVVFAAAVAPALRHSSGCDPDLWLYRDRTVGLLKRYLRYSVQVGRLPSLLGREFFRTRVTSYHAGTFEDAVIFVHDVERALGVLIGAVLSLLGSWWVAKKYFNQQRKIDKEKEELDVQLSYTKLVHAYFKMLGKRPKQNVHEAMAEFETKLKIYNRKFEAKAMQIQAGEQAAQTIKDNPEDFEDIQR